VYDPTSFDGHPREARPERARLDAAAAAEREEVLLAICRAGRKKKRKRH
jgi:hypothetical protein